MNKTFFSMCMSLMLIIGLTGCGDDITNKNIEIASGTVTGRLLDAETYLPVENATVSLIVNGEKLTTNLTTAGDYDLKGYFAIGGVSAGVHTLIVRSPNYGEFSTAIQVAQTNDNAPHTVNIGLIYLNKAFNLSVIVTDKGAPVEGALVNIMQGYRTLAMGTSDAGGLAYLQGLSCNSSYDIVVPAWDADGDMIYDYETTQVTLDAGNITDQTIAIALNEAGNDEVGIIAMNTDVNHRASFYIVNSTDVYGYQDFGLYGSENYYDADNGIPACGRTQPLMFVFNYPISYNYPDLSVSWHEYLVDPTSSGFDSEEPVWGAMTSIDTTGTILTVTPPTEGWPKVNSVITLSGTISPHSGSESQSIIAQVYVENDSASGLSQSTIVTADNYNGGDGFDDDVYLEFPEYVYGSFRILSTKAAGSTTWTDFSSNDNTYNFYTGELIYTDGTTGSEAGVFYRARLRYLTLGDGDMVRVEYEATDVAGNTIARMEELVVQ